MAKLDRRQFASLLLRAGAVAFSLPAWATTVGSLPFVRPKLSIAQIFTMSYPAALTAVLHKRTFANPDLEAAYNEGRITFKTLGAVLVKPGLEKLPVIRQGYEYARIQELSVPIVWSKHDEELNPSEENKINLVARLIENGVESHDDVMATNLRKYRELVISTQYHREIGYVHEFQNRAGYCVKIYTAFAGFV